MTGSSLTAPGTPQVSVPAEIDQVVSLESRRPRRWAGQKSRQDERPAQGPWHTVAVLLLLATALITSWVVPPLSQAWTSIDQAAFRWLNGSLHWDQTWQMIVAFLNSRAFDLIAGALLVGLLSLSIVRADGKRQRVSWTGLAVFAVMVSSGRAVLFDGVVAGVFAYERASPTLVYADGVQLSQLYPDWRTKDRSPWSFPGDHGYYSLAISLFLTLYARRPVAVAGWLVTLMCSLPRVISGAHWLTDVFVGSLSCAFVTLAAFAATPVGRRCHRPASG